MDQIVNVHWIIEQATGFQESIYFCFIYYAKAFDCVDHNNCGKFFKSWEYQTTFSASWEIYMQVKKQQLQPDMEQQTCFKLGREYIIRNAGLDEAQGGVKTARRNINNLR